MCIAENASDFVYFTKTCRKPAGSLRGQLTEVSGVSWRFPEVPRGSQTLLHWQTPRYSFDSEFYHFEQNSETGPHLLPTTGTRGVHKGDYLPGLNRNGWREIAFGWFARNLIGWRWPNLTKKLGLYYHYHLEIIKIIRKIAPKALLYPVVQGRVLESAPSCNERQTCSAGITEQLNFPVNVCILSMSASICHSSHTRAHSRTV